MADWQPLITDPARRAELVAVIREIVAAIPPPETLSLHVDHAVLRAYLAQDEMIEDPDDAVGTSLAAAVTAFTTTHATPALYGGACGIGWSIEHLAGGDTAERVCAAVDRALMHRLGSWTEEYDLISGLVGFGVYALERGEAGHPVVDRVLSLLEATARPQLSGLAWHTAPEQLPEWQRKTMPDGYWNLGVAHGIPGVIGWLARCVRHNACKGRARVLLDGAMTYLIAARPPTTEARYPAWLPSSGPNRRVAWCYGDLGVAFGMFAAAQACDREDWRAEALALARGCAGADDATIRDAGLCHGTAGALHLFARLWHATGEGVFADAARRWLERTLAIRRAGEDYAGFPALLPEAGGDRWVPSASLLAGAPGVALALHAAVSSIEPTWDRVLLVDL